MVWWNRGLRTAAFALFLSSYIGVPARALACGGGFFQEQTLGETRVTGHRIAFAVSETRTVLWDQLVYSGSPADFSWVLPVEPGAYVEASNDAWFEALEAVTKVRVAEPLLNCPSAEGGCGCGSAEAGDSKGVVDDDPAVDVIHEGTVGPYETATLRSSEPDALVNYLHEHGYLVPAHIEPVIDAYVEEGYDFIALRLSPGVSVQAMTPVRVITPNGAGRLPMRMLSAGIGTSVDIVLYVIGEARYGMPDLREVFVEPENVTWDFAKDASNYEALREEALAELLGRNYLTAFADQQAFRKTYTDPITLEPLRFELGDAGSTSYENFWSLYFARAAANERPATGSSPSPGSGEPLPPGTCPELDELLASTALVSETPGADELAADAFRCLDYTDIAAALVGMHPADVWTTRLELSLPSEALEADCEFEPAASQQAVEQLFFAGRIANPPCAAPVFESRIARGPLGRPEIWLGALAAALFSVRRARRSRQGA